ncbi:hypothetical protein [Streptomyces sp. PH10-H1]|uniref:hypothetical protein n=1 Tax=Streptomyces sp. PH10-H1 TaxID=3046212 RepID=UPI0024BB9A5F|nr:hypothetical protein [Streptomyces sp. PH10-H1]MDJ0346749.1 hypothetical protein [Streptomyces sp. PH10-H1]
MSARFPIPRPTEDAAIRNASRNAAGPLPVEVLFDAMVHAYAVDDRFGLRYFGLAIVRNAGGPARAS